MSGTICHLCVRLLKAQEADHRRHDNRSLKAARDAGLEGVPQQRLMEHFPGIEEIADKVLWGADWSGPGVPVINDNIAKFRASPIAEEAKRKKLYDNAARLFPRESGTHTARNAKDISDSDDSERRRGGRFFRFL